MEPVINALKLLLVAGKMDETRLNQLLKNIPRYQGSFALDELKNVEIKTFPEYIVINLENRGEPGNHWIALAIYQRYVYVCDSLGGILPDNKFPTALINFLHILLFSRTLVISKQLQPLDSDKCGEYCVVFIKEMSRHNSFSSFMKLFSTNLRQNDQIISFLRSQ